MARPRTRRPVNNPGNPLPQPEQEADRFARTNDVVISAGKAYADAREAWKRAVAELEASDPCAANHPSKVTAAILAFGNYLEAAKEVQARCKKS